jgi:hypothetical protein
MTSVAMSPAVAPSWHTALSRSEWHRLDNWFVPGAVLLGWGDLRRDDAIRAFVRRHPFVAFRPADPSQDPG